MPKRRTLLLITEGTSDANALAAPLQKLLNEVRLGDFQVRCDVTTARLFPDDFEGKYHFNPGWNVGQTVDGLVDEYLAQQGREATSLGWIAHLTDLDGAFIDDSLVVQDPSSDHREYSTNGIISPSRAATLADCNEPRPERGSAPTGGASHCPCLAAMRRVPPYRRTDGTHGVRRRRPAVSCRPNGVGRCRRTL